ncbi:MAG: IS3 family transposase [Bacteroidia bacterium]|nr:IS3 family transposase [Bacteroidia bacterium]
MRYSQAEKYELIQLVEQSGLSVRKTLKELDIHPSTFYNWYNRYLEKGYEGLAPSKSKRKGFWNRIPDAQREEVVDLALDKPELSPRELAFHIQDKKGWFISESSVYRILKARGLITSPAFILIKADKEFKDKTTEVNQMWQTDFSYFKVIGWGWYYLSTVLDDYSRFILSWNLSPTMRTEDAEHTIKLALDFTNLSKEEAPRLLSDNGSSYISDQFKEFLEEKGLSHIRGRPNHPQTQGKIERYHRSIKNVIKLENYFFPDQLRENIREFVNHYNHHRHHESLENLTPADVYFQRGEKILERRQKIKTKTLNLRRSFYKQTKTAAST